MWLDRALQFHIAALAVLGAIFIGFSHELTMVAVMAAIAAVIAVLVTDLLGWVRLNRWLANGIIVFAVGWSLRDFIQISPEEKLMAIASMLCYVQVVLLFQEKNTRIYWQLLMLCTLQVVVAGALELGSQFGFLLAVYATAAISMVMLLCLHREVRRTPAVAKVPAPPAKQGEWNLLLAKPELELPHVTAADVGRALTPRVLIRQTVLLAAVTLLFAAVFFYATPRLGDRTWQGPSISAGGITGLRPEIRFDKRGRVHLSNQVVMRVALSRMADRKPIELVGEPYFHGALLTDYLPDEQNPQDSRWVQWRPSTFGSTEPRGWLMRTGIQQSPSKLVREDIVLEATTSRRRPAIMPTQNVPDFETVTYGPRTRPDADSSVPRQQRYSVATPAIVSDRQLRAIANPNPGITANDQLALVDEIRRSCEIDHNRFPRLVEMAAHVLEEHAVVDGSSFSKAIALERHFLSPDTYKYSLNLDFPVPSGIDPIEDFVANHRTGHCEYFASALALMLRSQGVPARVVVGYKGGAYNSVGNYYSVQQRHVHSWVEAWIPTDDVPVSEIAGVPNDGGAWYRLDPTPGNETAVAVNQDGLGNRLAQAFDYVELLWRDYVLSLDKNRQDDAVYQPMTARAAILPSWVESRGFQRWLRRLSVNWGLDLPPGRSRSNTRAFEGSLAVLVIGGLILLLIAGQCLRLAGRALNRWRSGEKRTARAARSAPAFYQRLERLLARLPLVRQEGQTARELAIAAQTRLSQAEGAVLAARVPSEVVAAYYRVRFGGHRLDKSETEAIEQALAALAPAVRQAKKR
jgi:protein-glutamine gamma-glutamyltransferase